MVRAHYRDGDLDVDSNLTVILAGIALKEIALRPDRRSRHSRRDDQAFGSKKNPPMILAADENGYVFDKGLVLLDDVVFELLGSATISLKDLLDAMRPLIEAAFTAALLLETGPAAPVLARAFSTLMIIGILYAGTQFLSDVSSCRPRSPP